jgi:hypothetical protein
MYIKLQNEITTYPYSIKKLKQDNPQVSFPDTIDQDFKLLADYDVYKVTLVATPSYDPKSHKLTEVVPTLQNGVWTQTWQLVELTQQEKSDYTDQIAVQVRNQRNQLLAQSDWTQVADSPVDKVAWALYRQELRNITNQLGFPLEITWPKEPK